MEIEPCKLGKQKRGWDKRSRPHFLLAIKLWRGSWLNFLFVF